MPGVFQPARSAGYWATVILAAVIMFTGFILGLGGAWLLVLGGSWYYLVAGIALVAAGVLMVQGRMLGVWVYLATYVFTLIWAFWEAGMNGWALVPRLAAPTVLLVLVLLGLAVYFGAALLFGALPRSQLLLARERLAARRRRRQGI